MARPKKYSTVAALKKAVDSYFASISYQQKVIIARRELLPNQQTGEITVQEVPEELLDGNGKNVMETVWLEEPSKAGLCLHLGISRDTWAEYAKCEELKPVTDYVDSVMLKHLSELLNTKNSVQGIIFNLKANYGWTDRVEVTHKEMGLEDYLKELEENGEGE